MVDVLYIISHAPDNRYLKRFDCIGSRYSQAVMYWDKSSDGRDLSIPIDAEAIHIPANQTDPLKRIRETVIFSRRAYKRIESYAPKCLYVGNLDMLFIASRYKRKHPQVHIVYEIADLHRLIADEQHGAKAVLKECLIRLERKMMLNVSLLVLTSMKFYDVYYSNLIRDGRVVFMPNLPIGQAFKEFDPSVRPKKFTVGFIGWVRYLDQLYNLLSAAERCNINVLVAGADNSGPKFKEKCNSLDNVEYCGPFNYVKDVASLYERVDCVYSVYNADLFNVRVALPNKLYEAILTKRPIIVARGTYLSEVVEELGIGVSVNHRDVDDVEKGIKFLMEKGNYKKLSEACERNACLTNEASYNSALLNSVTELLG